MRQYVRRSSRAGSPLLLLSGVRWRDRRKKECIIPPLVRRRKSQQRSSFTVQVLDDAAATQQQTTAVVTPPVRGDFLTVSLLDACLNTYRVRAWCLCFSESH